jgi:hypothetical protein
MELADEFLGVQYVADRFPRVVQVVIAQPLYKVLDFLVVDS